jgi:hypothetical protein
MQYDKRYLRIYYLYSGINDTAHIPRTTSYPAKQKSPPEKEKIKMFLRAKGKPYLQI